MLSSKDGPDCIVFTLSNELAFQITSLLDVSRPRPMTASDSFAEKVGSPTSLLSVVSLDQSEIKLYSKKRLMTCYHLPSAREFWLDLFLSVSNEAVFRVKGEWLRWSLINYWLF